MASWNTMAMRRPRIACISRAFRPVSSRPSKRTEPETTRPGGSTRPRIENPVTDLPDPDSPTSPSTSPGWSVKDTPSTAFTTPARVMKCVLRSSTSRSGAALIA